MSTTNPASILHHFADLRDPRIERCKRHDLFDIVVITICAVICGANSCVHIARYGQCKKDWLKGFLRLPNGIPSHDTFLRVLSLLDPQEFLDCFQNWVAAVSKSVSQRHCAVDGKALRGSLDRANGKSPVHLVSAWATDCGVLLGQQRCDAKSNEITAIPKLLELLDLSGALVTIDAMGCQKEIAQQIRNQGGDYVLALKGNQEQIHEDVQKFFDEQIQTDFSQVPYSHWHTRGRGHGRLEERHYYVLDVPDELRHRQEWPDLRSIGMVYSQRTVNGVESEEYRYYLLSIPRNAKRFGQAVRGHWDVENRLHWVLDVSFREDECRIRDEKAAENFGLLRRLAVGLLNKDATAKCGIEGKRLSAGWDDDYLLRALSSFSKE